jgi:hypothetical protein
MQTFLDARAVAQDITAIARHKLTDRLRHRGRWKELPIDSDQLGGRNSKKRERLFAGGIAMPLDYFDQQSLNVNNSFASIKGIIAKSVHMFSVGRAAIHTSWPTNLPVDLPAVCRPAASG